MKLPFTKKKQITDDLGILHKENIRFAKESMSEKDAIDEVGKMLLKAGYIEEKYIRGMHQRDHQLSVYVGNFLAIPHGEFEFKENIIRSGIAVLIFQEAIDWHGQAVHFVIALAGKGEEHMKILSNIATVFSDEVDVLKLLKTNSIDSIYQAFAQGGLQ